MYMDKFPSALLIASVYVYLNCNLINIIEPKTADNPTFKKKS